MRSSITLAIVGKELSLYIDLNSMATHIPKHLIFSFAFLKGNITRRDPAQLIGSETLNSLYPESEPKVISDCLGLTFLGVQ